jgi:DNA polymerase-3 subunit epsilon
MTTNPTIPQEQLDAAIALLTLHGFQMLEKFSAPTVYREPDVPEGRLTLGVVLDTETTGKNAATDFIVELGMVFFEYDPETGVVYRIVEVFNELQDPGVPIPPEASAVNGITDDMVRGKVIDGQRVADLVTFVSIVIAHNSAFDRQLCERFWPIFAKLPWACSFRQIPWQDEGIGSGKLDYIAYRRGFHYAAHRAEEDCRVLLHVLQAPFAETGAPTLKALLDASNKCEMRIWATGAPFEVKDALSGRGYRWCDGSNGMEKAWNITVTEDNLETELAWLKVNAFRNRSSSVVVDTVDATNRFSARRGLSKQKYL